MISYEISANGNSSPDGPKIDYLEIAQSEVDSEPFQSMLDKEFAHPSKYFNSIISSAGGAREIALTFDDGPHPGYTEKLLKILEKYNVKGTFFVVGKKAVEHPDYVRKLFDAGHSIGNHTFSHVDLTDVYLDDAAVEIKACGKILYSITGKYCDLFRPPGGNFNRDIGKIAKALGYTTILWTANSADYSKIDKNAIKKRIFSRIGQGGIILMHDGIQKTLDLLPEIIQTLKVRGYRFVTIDEIRSRRWAYKLAAKSNMPLKTIGLKKIISVSEEASTGTIHYAQ